MESVHNTGKPLQLISYAEKIKDNGKWFEQNCNYVLSRANFSSSAHSIASDVQSRDLPLLYSVFNSKFPAKWFTHITDPLSAESPAHKNFPAKVRPINWLRTNLELLLSEYPRRPFIYQVNNLSDEGYSEYQEQLNQKLQANITEHFQNMLKMQLIQQGILTEDGQPVSEEAAKQVEEALSNLQYPNDIQESFQASYKDKIAIQGQTWLRRTIAESILKPKFLKNFKHWLITGEAYSYKTVNFGSIIYDTVSPLDIRYIKSPENDFIEDAESVARRMRLTVSDIVDRYYDVLKKEMINQLEMRPVLSSSSAFYDHLSANAIKGLHNVYHVTWKGKKCIKYIIDENGEEITVDEDYVLGPNESFIGEDWVNEIYECTKIGDYFVNKRPILYQRNAMNNFSTCKQPYNGRCWSDLHSENIGPLELGIPFLIMGIITNRAIELTIAKSKGKILLIDQNAIPNTQGWTEEKAFYYAEARGYMVLNRNQVGVDKSWNQYQVLDMTLFDSIKQLIDLQQHFKQEWDDILGINRQRKGQTYASDAVGNNERAAFQSTVITDSIFNIYEEFIEKELQGLLDLSRFTNIDGVKKLWNDTELGNQLLEIDPVQYSTTELGVVVESSSEALQVLKALQGDAQAMLQNGAKPSTIAEIRSTLNIASLKAKLKQIEDLQAKAEQAMAANEQEAQKMADERQKEFAEYTAILERATMHEEYDRKEDIELIRAEANMFTFKAADESTPNGVPDILELEAHKLERDKHRDAMAQQNLDRAEKLKTDSEDRKLKREEMKSKEKIAKKKSSTK